MAANTSIRNATCIAMLNLLVDSLDAGSGPGIVRVFDGSMPGKPADADAGTKLAEFTLSDPAFGAAADNGAHGATATASVIADVSAVANGSADYFRAYDSNLVCYLQGTVAVSGADFIVNDAAFSSGDTVSVLSWAVTLPDGSD